MPIRSGAILPLGCFGANHADGALRVPEFNGMVVPGSEAVFQNERLDAQRVPPIRATMLALFIHGEVGVTAAGTHDYRRSRGAIAFGEVGRNRRLVDVF